MAHLFISDLKEGAVVKQFFLVRQAEDRFTRDGKRYRNLKLSDRTGVIAAKAWDETLKRFPEPVAACDFLGVRGKVEAYQGELQLNLDYFEMVEKIRARGGDLSEFDPELLILATGRDREEMWRELLELAQTHINPPLKALVLALLERYQAQLMEWPRAEALHHAYLGGLLEHTLGVTKLAEAVAVLYPTIDRPLLLAGAITHDLGKLIEFDYDSYPYDYSVRGRLVGHMVYSL